MKKTDLNTDQEVILTLNMSFFWGLLKANIYIFCDQMFFFIVIVTITPVTVRDVRC